MVRFSPRFHAVMLTGILLFSCVAALQLQEQQAKQHQAVAANEDNADAASNLFFYDACRHEMLDRLDEGIASNGSNTSLTNQDKEVLAIEICKCAAPKFSHMVQAALDKPNNAETEKIFQQKSYEAINDCASSIHHF